MLPRNIRLSIVLAQLVAVATLMRSVALDRWITVFASALLLVGASAALRNRAWGVALMFAQAIAFPVAYMIGIAPSWFCLVGVFGMMPFLLTAPGFARVDRGATRVLAALAVAGGAIGAMAWKEIAWSVFESFPSLMPTVYPHHGFIVMAIAALGTAIAIKNRHIVDDAPAEAGAGAGEAARMRVAQSMRIAESESPRHEQEEDIEEEEVLGRRMRR